MKYCLYRGFFPDLPLNHHYDTFLTHKGLPLVQRIHEFSLKKHFSLFKKPIKPIYDSVCKECNADFYAPSFLLSFPCHDILLALG